MTQVMESALASLVAAPPQRLLVLVTEGTTAQVVTASHVGLLGQPLELANVLALLPPHKTLGVIEVLETGLPESIVGLRLLSLALHTETAIAPAIGTTKTVEIVGSEEVAQALGLTWSPQARLVVEVTEADMVSLLTTISGIIMYAISGTWSIMAVVAGVPAVTPAVEGAQWETAPVLTGEITMNEYE